VKSQKRQQNFRQSAGAEVSLTPRFSGVLGARERILTVLTVFFLLDCDLAGVREWTSPPACRNVLTPWLRLTLIRGRTAAFQSIETVERVQLPIHATNTSLKRGVNESTRALRSRADAGIPAL